MNQAKSGGGLSSEGKRVYKDDETSEDEDEDDNDEE
jgi:hypothetical protein